MAAQHELDERQGSQLRHLTAHDNTDYCELPPWGDELTGALGECVAKGAELIEESTGAPSVVREAILEATLVRLFAFGFRIGQMEREATT